MPNGHISVSAQVVRDNLFTTWATVTFLIPPTPNDGVSHIVFNGSGTHTRGTNAVSESEQPEVGFSLVSLSPFAFDNWNQSFAHIIGDAEEFFVPHDFTCNFDDNAAVISTPHLRTVFAAAMNGGGGVTLRYHGLWPDTYIRDPYTFPARRSYKLGSLTAEIDYFTTDPLPPPKPPKPDEDAASKWAMADVRNNIIALGWTVPVSDNNRYKTLYIGVNRSVTKHIGSGSGATGGWEVYALKTLDARALWGLVFLANDWLEVKYEAYEGDTATAVYTINKQFGAGPKANWSDPLPTDSAPQLLQGGRSIEQAFGLRIG